MASGDTKTEALLNILGNGGDASEYRGCCNTKTQDYILDAIDRVDGVEEEVETLKNNPDVVDIVDTYADLQSYDTSTLTDKDIIRVLEDETHSGNSTFYRFTKNPDTWTFIGEVSGGGTLYTTVGQNEDGAMTQKATTDMIFGDGGTGYKIKIGSDTTDAGDEGIAIGHSASSGASESIAIGHGATVGSDNTEAIAIGHGCSVSGYNSKSIAIGHNSVANNANKAIVIGEKAQSYGGSSVIVLGENANANSLSIDGIAIGRSAGAANSGVTIGVQASAPKYGIAIGCDAKDIGVHEYSVLLGYHSRAYNDATYSVGLGAHSKPTIAGEVNISTIESGTPHGYNGTHYRIINGVHDGINNHCAATVAQGNTLATSAPTTTTEGVLGQLYTDTTNMHTYQCTAIDTTDPDNPSYTWTQRW